MTLSRSIPSPDSRVEGCAARPFLNAGGAHRASSAGPVPTDLVQFAGLRPESKLPAKRGQLQ